MSPKSCFFLGHADTPSELYPALLAAIERHVSDFGVTEFFVGSHGTFDRLALRALTEVKAGHPYIRLIYVQPYHPGLNPASPDGFDESFYPFDMPVHPRYAIAKANRKMIETCDFLIACVWHSGRARSFFEYAQRREKQGKLHIENLKRDE